ncbi:MAG: EthD family reductase [Sphingomicrobium sp.]
MYILTITYPRSADASFDFDYFRQTHLPQVGEAFGPFGLGYASVLRGEQGLDGGEPAYFATTILSFPTEQGAKDAVASEAGRALAADIANFTSVTPIMQFNTSVA